jgi:hypothetical protein
MRKREKRERESSGDSISLERGYGLGYFHEPTIVGPFASLDGM